MEHRKNPNYGRTKCFHCLLDPSGDDPTFTGINRLVAKGLEIEKKNNNNDNFVHYPCPVVNRFECPYEKDNVSLSVNTKKKFDVEDLFELEKMAFAVEFALAVAEKDTSAVRIKNKQDLYHALTDTETLDKILEQALDYL